MTSESGKMIRENRRRRRYDPRGYNGFKIVMRRMRGFWVQYLLNGRTQIGVRSRKDLEQEQHIYQGPKLVEGRIWVAQRKMWNAERKLGKVQEERKDIRQKFDEHDWKLEERVNHKPSCQMTKTVEQEIKVTMDLIHERSFLPGPAGIGSKAEEECK